MCQPVSFCNAFHPLFTELFIKVRIGMQRIQQLLTELFIKVRVGMQRI